MTETAKGVSTMTIDLVKRAFNQRAVTDKKEFRQSLTKQHQRCNSVLGQRRFATGHFSVFEQMLSVMRG